MARYSKSIASFADVHQAFGAAGSLGSLTLTFETSAAATVWVGRANAYRVLLAKQNEAAGKPYASPFDHLMVRRPADRLTVLIEPRGFGFKSAVGPNGEQVSFDKASTPAGAPTALTEAEREAAAFLAEFEKGKRK